MSMNFISTWIILFLLTKRTILQNISQIDIYLLLPHGAYILSQNEFPVTKICFYFPNYVSLATCMTICLTFKCCPRSTSHQTGLLQQCLFAGLTVAQMSWLQSVLRAASPLVLGLTGCGPVSTAMHETLVWLIYPHWVTYKLCFLAHKFGQRSFGTSDMPASMRSSNFNDFRHLLKT